MKESVAIAAMAVLFVAGPFPATVAQVPPTAAEKAAYVEKFKQELTELGKTYDQLEALIKDGKNAEAKAVFDKISEQKEKGHKDFGVDEE